MNLHLRNHYHRTLLGYQIASEIQVLALSLIKAATEEVKLKAICLMGDRPAVTQPQLVSRIHVATSNVLRMVSESCCTSCDRADCEVVLEKLWWKILDFEALRQTSVTFFDNQEPESAISCWVRARIRVAKVGKGLSNDKKTKKLLLAFKYWIEAVDPLHRYGTNLYPYYVAWYNSESSQPFFYWLDFGHGKEVTLEECPRTDLQYQCVKYLGPKDREEYEVIVDSGKLVYRHSGSLVETPEGTKWIYVLSTSRVLYVGEKKKGTFQHSSFLAGGATISAGRIVACNGILQAIWAYSGHYRPTEENLKELMSFLEGHHVDLSLVKTVPTDDDIPPPPKPPAVGSRTQNFSNIVI